MPADTLPTSVELAQVGERELRDRLDPQGTGRVNLRDGSRNTTAISTQVSIAQPILAHVADRVAARDLESATGDDLTAIARDRYKTDRKVAHASLGPVYLYRATAAAATNIPKGSRFGVPADSTGSQPAVEFIAIETVAVQAGKKYVGVELRCSQEGEVGNVDRTEITAILDTLPDTTWTVYATPTGAEPSGEVQGTIYPADTISGGAEAEDDDVLRARLKQLPEDASEQRGTKAAIEFGAGAVPGIRFVNAIEPGSDYGNVIVYAGDANYALSTAMKNLVDTSLNGYRCFGVPCIVRGYTTQVVTISAQIYMTRPLVNYDITALQAKAVALINAYFDGRERANEFIRNKIEAACLACDPDTQEVNLTLSPAEVVRPPDSSYAGAGASLSYRYIVTASSVLVYFSNPKTT